MASPQDARNMSNVAGTLQALGFTSPVIGEKECLPFTPPEYVAVDLGIPRYLFRIVSEHSAASTDSSWARSRSAKMNDPTSAKCLFDLDRMAAADMLYRHLTWQQPSTVPDNLVSWTSSMLYALIHVICRRTQYRALDTSFCIIDTDELPHDAFMSDLDLVRALKSRHDGLQEYEALCKARQGESGGWHYFGEYISQGSLKIENCCKIVKMSQLIARGLLNLHPRFPEYFCEYASQPVSWADQIRVLRAAFYRDGEEEDEEPAVVFRADPELTSGDLGNLFGPFWRIPVALSMYSIVPKRGNPAGVLERLDRHFPVTFDELEDCAESRAGVVADERLPEVQEYGRNLQLGYLVFGKDTLGHWMDDLRKRMYNANRLARMLSAERRALGGEQEDVVIPEATARFLELLSEMDLDELA